MSRPGLVFGRPLGWLFKRLFKLEPVIDYFLGSAVTRTATGSTGFFAIEVMQVKMILTVIRVKIRPVIKSVRAVNVREHSLCQVE
jgi:hypothetical protein